MVFSWNCWGEMGAKQHGRRVYLVYQSALFEELLLRECSLFVI